MDSSAEPHDDGTCPWALSSALMRSYHDTEWGVPSHDEAHVFEMLILEGAQAGLSWATILRRREGYRRAFGPFDPAVLAALTDSDLALLAENTEIIRNRAKIASVRANASATLRLGEEFSSLSSYLWGWTDNARIVHHPARLEDLPPTTELSDRVSKDMKKRGFSFVGSTIVYSLLQSIGIIDDHIVGCPRKRN